MKTRKYVYLSLVTVFVLLIQLLSPALVYADDETPPVPSEAPVETSVPEVTEAPTEVAPTEPPIADPSLSMPEPTESLATASPSDTPPVDDPSDLTPTDSALPTVEPMETETSDPTQPALSEETATPPPADLATDVPTESPTLGTLSDEPTSAATAPSDLDEHSSDAPTKEPIETGTPTPEPTETLEVAPSSSEPTETATTVDATSEPTLLQAQQQLSDNTNIVVLDENGQPLPLATQEAAEVVANGDPMWCPAGVAPGGVGCTTSYTSLASLLSDLSALNGNTGIGADGTIWIESSYDSAVNDPSTSGFALNGSALTTWANYSLGLQGGWSGILGDTTIGPNSVFSVPITISDWHNTVYIANLTTTNDINIDNTDGVVILADVRMNNANLDGQKGRVDIYNSTGNLNITNADINNNGLYSAGVNIHTLNGDVTVSNSSFHGNGYDGIWMNSVNNVFIDNSMFFQNANNGMSIYNANNVTINNNSSFNGNGGMGASISNVANVDISDSTFNNNLFHGIYVSNTTGNVTLQNITSTASASTYGDGAYIDNTWGTGNVTLTGTNDFSNHSPGNSGMFILSNGDVSLDGITSSNNGRGVNISQAVNVTISNGMFSDNCCNYEGTGAYVFADGAVSINQSIFNRNSLYVNTIGDVAVDRVTVDGSSGFGLGVESFGGDVTISNSSFINTVANSNNALFPWGDGADIFSYYGGKVTVTQSHFIGNAFDGLYVDYPVAYPGDVIIDQSHFNNNLVGGLDILDANRIDIRASEFTANAPNYDLIASCYTGIPPQYFRDLSLIFDDSPFPGIPALIDILVDKNCDYSQYSNTASNAPPRIGKQRIAKNQLVSTGRNSRTLLYRGKAEFWLNCGEQYNFKVNLPNGDRVDIYCPVSGKATITRMDNTTLPAELPTGYTFASAFDVEVLQPSIPLTRDPASHDYLRTPIPVIKEGGHIMASFVAPPLQSGKTFSILYWDNDNSQWIPLKDFLFGRTFKLFPDVPADQREILSGVLPNSKIAPDRVQVSTNFPGIFVLAQH